MNNINFIKSIDNLGRIVIPMDIRRQLSINTGDILSITCNDKNVILSKYSSLEGNGKIIEIIKSFIELFKIKVILLNKEYVIYSNIVSLGNKIDNGVKNLVLNANVLQEISTNMIFGDKSVNGIYNMLPILSNEGVIGSLIVFSDNNIKGFNMCSIMQKLINLELNIS